MYSIAQFPQADRLEKVIQVINAIENGAATDVDIAGAIGYTARQGRYYRHATELLGFITNYKNHSELTELGRTFVDADTNGKSQIIRTAVLGNVLFKELIEFVRGRGNASEKEILEHLFTITNAEAHSTIPRRLKTIMSWLQALELFVESDIEEPKDGDEIRYEVNENAIQEEVEVLQDLSSLERGEPGRTLYEIPIDEISPNPHNPRLIFEQDDLDDLRKSIAKVGVLVPVTVYRNTKAFPKTQYVLLDGERRWRCSRELGAPTIPANVIDEPRDVTQNILFMFNIHHFRKEWALFPTALKLEVLIKRLGTDQESVIHNFTGVSKTTIRRCKILLWYPRRYRDVLMEKSSKVSTDFFIEIYPIAYRLSQEEQFSFPIGIQRFIDSCIAKFEDGTHITDVKEFREMRKAMGFFEKNNDFGMFLNQINRFISEDIGLEIFHDVRADDDRTRANVLKYIAYLNANLADINRDLLSDIASESQLRHLLKLLTEILEEID